ncbi:MAG TPA: class I SAM-dependent methyltransferase [Rubrobacter sp.]|jgi:ubiquinone/menaquinone biosynthesis C-methylase UbiE|nr:class I SAM-dependent methyltransferase [Rubrobacter sp.]
MGRSRDDHETGPTRGGHPVFAALYDLVGASAERRWMGARRRRLLAGARGAVLEIGGGTGANLAHYRNVDRVTIAEPDPFMRSRIGPKLEDARVPVEVSAAGAEALPFPDGSFDTVVSTLVLCTVPDQAAALDEVRRILRPGGRLLFIEHVRAAGSMARWQDRLEPLWRRLFGGCHPNRDTVAAIEEAGFEIETFESFYPPDPLSVLTPHVQGSATVRLAA